MKLKGGLGGEVMVVVYQLYHTVELDINIHIPYTFYTER